MISQFYSATKVVIKHFYEPFWNPTIFHLMSWFYCLLITKSIGEVNALVKEILLAHNFNQEHLIRFIATKENSFMNSYRQSVRGLSVSLSSLNLWLVASALSCASVDLQVDFWQLPLSVKSFILVLHFHGLEVAFARLPLASAIFVNHSASLSLWLSAQKITLYSIFTYLAFFLSSLLHVIPIPASLRYTCL